jgi:hypothetical protein
VSYEIRREKEILRIVFAGTLTNDDLCHYAVDLEAIEEANQVIPNRIADVRPVQRLEIDFGGVRALAEARRPRKFNNSFKAAVIAEDIVHFGFARMFQTLNDHRQIVLAIFGNEKDAHAWLSLPDLEPPKVPWQPRRARAPEKS